MKVTKLISSKENVLCFKFRLWLDWPEKNVRVTHRHFSHTKDSCVPSVFSTLTAPQPVALSQGQSHMLKQLCKNVHATAAWLLLVTVCPHLWTDGRPFPFVDCFPVPKALARPQLPGQLSIMYLRLSRPSR